MFINVVSEVSRQTQTTVISKVCLKGTGRSLSETCWGSAAWGISSFSPGFTEASGGLPW